MKIENGFITMNEAEYTEFYRQYEEATNNVETSESELERYERIMSLIALE